MFPDLNPMINLCLLSLSELKAQVSFSDWLSSVRPSVCLSICKLFTFSTSSPEPLGQFQPNFNKKHPWVEGIQFWLNEGSGPFPRGDNSENVKLYWKIFKNLLLQNHLTISTKLDTKHPWVVGIEDCSNEGPHRFQSGYNYEIAKTQFWNLKKSSPEPVGQFQPNLPQSILG